MASTFLRWLSVSWGTLGPGSEELCVAMVWAVFVKVPATLQQVMGDDIMRPAAV